MITRAHKHGLHSHEESAKLLADTREPATYLNLSLSSNQQRDKAMYVVSIPLFTRSHRDKLK